MDSSFLYILFNRKLFNLEQSFIAFNNFIIFFIINTVCDKLIVSVLICLTIIVCSQLGEEVICHKADLRFVSISGQKVLDTVQEALEQAGGSNPALYSTSKMVTDQLHDANHRYTGLHTKVSMFMFSGFMFKRNSTSVHTRLVPIF